MAITGETLGTYVVERPLGRGAMAVVYLARDLRHDRLVALKVLRPEVAQAVGVGRFVREIRIAAQVHHPNILPLYDSGEVGGVLYYVMPWVEGGTLRDRLRREGPLAVDEALAIAAAVADALDAAHRDGFVHRDIKPENILLDEGRPLVADFGIARLIGAAAEGWVSTSGLVVGTPGYMSPEQVAGDHGIDGRSDVYSLACVLYEMLAGEPPFTGPTPQVIASRHLHERVPSLRLARPAVPAWLEGVVEDALAKVPVDRPASAADFAARLRGPPPPAAAPGRRRLVRVVAAAALIGAAATAAAGLARWRAERGIDPGLFAVLPFRAQAGADAGLSGEAVQALVAEAAGRWDGIRVAGGLQVREALARQGGTVAGLDDALRSARRLGAGHLVWGEVTGQGDTVLVRAALHDVRRGGAVVRERVVRHPATAAGLSERLAGMADALVVGAVAPGLQVAAGGPGTRSVAAVRAFAAGRAALDDWDLRAVRDRYREAVGHDPVFPQAHLGLALVGDWLGEPPAAWRDAVATAMARREALLPADRELAAALDQTVAGNHPAACRTYQARLARDTLDVVAWLGLGGCQVRDSLVEPDRASPSGWSFRSSYHAAVLAYRRALELAPGAHRIFRDDGFERLKGILFTEVAQVREGLHVGPDTLWFGAFPALEADTLAFVPRPRAAVLAGTPGAVPASVPAAVERNIDLLARLARTWIRAYPDRAEPRRLLAELLEAGGRINVAEPERDSALLLLREAAERTADPSQRGALAVARLRLLVKLREYHAARRTGDSLLAAAAGPGAAGAGQLAAVAQLLGRPDLASRLVHRSAAPPAVFWSAASEFVDVPSGVWQPAVTLLAHAVVGAPPDTIRALEARVEEAISGLVPDPRRGAVREAVFDDPATFAFLDLGLRPAHRPRAGVRFPLALQWHAGRGDAREVRGLLAALEARRRFARPGDVVVDGWLLEASALLALADTAGAVARLDAGLISLPASRLSLLEGLKHPGSLVRAMALRADLAHRRGEREAAARWAGAVVALWSGAEAGLRPRVARMEEILRAGE